MHHEQQIGTIANLINILDRQEQWIAALAGQVKLQAGDIRSLYELLNRMITLHQNNLR